MSNTPLTAVQQLRMTAVLAGFLLFFTISMATANMRDLHKSGFTAVQATILSSEQHTGFSKVSKATLPKLITDIEYEYELDGKSYKATETSESISDMRARSEFAAGKTLTVYANPKNPAEVTMEETKFAPTDFIGTAAFALGFLIALARCAILYTRRQSQPTN